MLQDALGDKAFGHGSPQAPLSYGISFAWRVPPRRKDLPIENSGAQGPPRWRAANSSTPAPSAAHPQDKEVRRDPEVQFVWKQSRRREMRGYALPFFVSGE